jgi:hypothetical protein
MENDFLTAHNTLMNFVRQWRPSFSHEGRISRRDFPISKSPTESPTIIDRCRFEKPYIYYTV